MAIYAGFSLSLLGDENDRMFHVLVSKEYEQKRDFYFPLSSDEYKRCKLEMAEIPFVKLGRYIDAKKLEYISYEQTVSALQKSISLPKLEFRLGDKRLLADEKEIHLSPSLYTIYLYFANNKKRGVRTALRTISSGEIRQMFEKIYGKNKTNIVFDLESSEYFLEKKSRINSILKRVLGGKADSYLIHTYGRRPNSEYDIKVLSNNIVIKD